MTTYTPFSPSPISAFTFQATLDGQTYNVVVTWSLFGQRWYVSVYDLNNNLVVGQGMTGSPPDADVDLVGGYFTTSSLVYRAASNNFEVSP